MSNPINDWIRGGKTPEGKDKRRKMVAWIALVAGLAAAPFTFGVTGVVGVVVFLVKMRNAAKDNT